MIMKSLFLSCVLWAVLWSLSIQYATAQDSQIAIGEIENTPLLLNQEAEAPELGPIKVVPIGSPGTAIAEDIYGFMWFGGNSGLYRYDGTEMIRFQREPYDSSSLSETWVESLHAGSDGTLWVGTFGGGLNRFNPETETFMHFRHEAGNPLSLSQDTVTVLLEDSRGVLWVGTHGGLNRFNKSTETFTRFQHDPEDSTSISNNQIRAIYEDSNGAIWIGTGSPAPSETPVGEGGLNRFNSETQSFTRYMHDPDDPSSLLNNKVMSIYEDSRGMFWVGTMGDGLHTMDRETGRFTRYSNDPGDPLTLSVPIPGNNIEFNRSGEISFRRYLPGRSIGPILEDDDGTIWVGTWGNGLLRFDPETGESDQFTTDDGLPANTVSAILQDDDGFIWVSTVEGQPQSPQNGSLSRFNPASISFANFTSQDGLPDIGFSMSALKSSDGLLFFGGIGGLTFFDPSLIQDPVYESPKIVLTGLHISNEQITPETSDLITRPMYLEDSLELSHDQNDVTIDYKAFAYINSDQVQYQYKLEPYDSEWVSARSQQSARYSQLSPGDYVFLVRTVDSRGGFNTEEATMAITIFPPWWQTWWAYGFYALMLAFGVFVVDRFQRRRLISKERERARERELEQEKKYSKQLQDAYSELEDSLQKLKAAQDQLIQQEKLASLGQLTAGIAHEIKNPLNFVNNFSDLSEEMIQELINAIKDGDLDEAEELANDISKNLQKIQEHGTSADSIVKSMLQHSRGGDGKAEPTPLNPLIKEYVNLAFHGMRAGENPINVDIDLQLDDSIGEVHLVSEDFSRVILNLSNNAFDAMRSKLTEDGGPGTGEKSPLEGSGDPESFREKRGVSSMEDYQPKLTVRTHQTDKSVTIDIEDNGPGIPDDMKDKILLPFFTTKKGTAGTGLGLSITNDIVKAHGGKMTATNMEESGARFTINLPV